MTDSPKLSPAAAEVLSVRGLGDLAAKMGIELVELSAEYSVARMPVLSNTQPLGVLHGGAHVVIAESLGSMSANVHAHPNGYAVGIELSASHHRSITEGIVTATCSAVKLGRTLTTHQIVMTDESGNLLSTVRITNFIRTRPAVQ